MMETRKHFDFKAVGSANGRIFIYLQEKRHYINNIEDINKLKGVTDDF